MKTMSRVSDRIGRALSSVKCPGCGNYVVPSIIPSGVGAAAGEQVEGKRWSFVWRPPRGEVCPQCDFPLSRYAGRIKWIRLFTAGVVLLTAAILLYVLGRISDLGGWFGWVMRATALVGVVAFLIGLVGLVVGGRHGPVQPGSRTAG
ncbi:MAG: hypothetical protein GTN62_01050 [Gemmatimonadales bacterium]|nr:hypothetical protein [Gemmatimonadales bacterium]NIN48691.1 hypothetical protein [Gemmatimonadales bacterium]NIP06155.1 hypothetical protein [Gemmatimonadales bacterium]NIR01329.1 hypothetical protein [Gemmatimonadales bacterium]